jgi:predicted dehydrogenase
VIVGSEKMVVYDDGAPEPVRVFDHGVVYKDPETFGEYQLSYRTGDIVSPRIDTWEPLTEEMSDFVAAAREGREPVASAGMARNVVRLAEAADLSLRQGGREVEIRNVVKEQLSQPTSDAELAIR